MASMHAVWRRLSRILKYVNMIVQITGFIVGMAGYRYVARPLYQLLRWFDRMSVGELISCILVIEFVSGRKFRWTFQRPEEPAEVDAPAEV